MLCVRDGGVWQAPEKAVSFQGNDVPEEIVDIVRFSTTKLLSAPSVHLMRRIWIHLALSKIYYMTERRDLLHLVVDLSLSLLYIKCSTVVDT